MNIRKFLLVNLFSILAITNGWGCAGEYSTHNYYMMDVAPRITNTLDFENRFNQYWKNYMNNNDVEYNWQKKEIMETAQKKGDEDMVAYLTQLNNFLDICDQLQETWSYPTKEQLAERKATLQKMKAAANSYRGARLRSQYALLAMRANMLLKDHQANIAYWNSNAGNLPENVYKDMMRNIYAGALFHTGNKKEAFDIYAEQGDQTSIRWAMRKYRNFAGIQNIFNENPNAASLYYLVSDFVNNVQESIDTEDPEWIANLDRVQILSDEARQFIDFADKAAANKTVNDQCLWKTASALTSYHLGDTKQAAQAIEQAMKLNGTQRAKDNARCVRLLIIANDPGIKGKIIRNEMEWLDAKAATEGENDYCFRNARDRILHKSLLNRYVKTGNKEMITAVQDLCDNKDSDFTYWNSRYSGEFSIVLDSMDASQLKSYYAFISSSHKDPLESYVTEKIYKDADYYNDMIATKLIAQNAFDEAIPYLENIPLSFFCNQNISYYAAHRDWTIPKWIKRQRMSENDSDGPNSGKVTENKKLKFCREMSDLKSRYNLASNNERNKLAYQLAVRYYQASIHGDCWYLSNYGWSAYSELMPWQANLEKIAAQYLSENKTITDFALRTESLFGLAYIAYDGPWAEQSYDWQTQQNTYDLKPETHQYKALAELSQFARKYAGRMPAYVTKCDVLKQFRKQQ
ncbi:MAG: hypothetical protein IJK46_01675 [Prevotella sp.]|nr:hypothetical protein [Prevotella sp.]